MKNVREYFSCNLPLFTFSKDILNNFIFDFEVFLVKLVRRDFAVVLDFRFRFHITSRIAILFFSAPLGMVPKVRIRTWALAAKGH